MKKTVEIHICDICSKEDNLGNKYEAGEGTLNLKGHVGSSVACGGASYDDKYDLYLTCFKKIQKLISNLKKDKDEK